MNPSDADLDRLFRAANPDPKRGDVRLTATEISLRESIIRGETQKRHSRRPRRGLFWAGLTTATAAVVVIALVAVGVLNPAQQAVALTPPPLSYAAASPLDEVMGEAETALRTPPDTAQVPGVHSVVWGWSAQMDTDEVEIVPQDVTFTWAPGQGSRTTIVAGESYWSENERPDGVGPSPYSPGDLIDEVVTPAEEFTLPADALNLTGSSPADLEKALVVFGATPDASSGELFAAVTGLLDYWTLSDEQHATILKLLDDAGGLTVRGETTDRLGRDVIGVQVSQVIPERRETFFISEDTGRIVGMESEIIKPLDGLPLGVITYAMWDAGR